MEIRIKNKRGMSHIEVILSFIMFVGFLLALFVIFPINYGEGMRIGLDSLENGIMNYAETNVGYVSFALNSSVSASCFTVDLGIDKKVVVKNETNGRMGALHSGGIVGINRSGGKFYTAYYSDDFVESGLNSAATCVALPEGNYSVGLKREYQIVSYKKILALNSSYYSDYKSAKTAVFVPEGDDFRVILKQNNGAEIVGMKINTPPRAAVYSRDIPVRVVYEDGAVDYLWFSLQVW